MESLARSRQGTQGCERALGSVWCANTATFIPTAQSGQPQGSVGHSRQPSFHVCFWFVICICFWLYISNLLESSSFSFIWLWWGVFLLNLVAFYSSSVSPSSDVGGLQRCLWCILQDLCPRSPSWQRGLCLCACLYLVLGMELRVSPMLSKLTIAEPYPPRSDNFQF